MRKTKIKPLIKLSTASVLTIIFMTIFSIPLISVVAPLGNILFPGGGIWRVPYEVPDYEIIHETRLNSSVTVYRDEWGIPHIYASTERDASFASGFVHAQDRMFQMDLARRLVRGTLSEVIGEAALEMDKFNLASGKLYWAQKTVEDIINKSETGEITFIDSLYRYCDGVNYYIDTHQHEWPLEYALLGFKPEYWSILDITCLLKYMAEMLSWSYMDLYAATNYYNLGSENYTELFRSTYGQIPICPNYGSYNDNSSLPYEEGVENPRAAVIETITSFLSNLDTIPSQKTLMDLKKQAAIGSNNWVVNGSKTRSGKPILCNDMHLSWSVPGIWYEAHIVVEETDLNTYGFTLPGAPMVIVGHNEHIAWGFTNSGYDVMDWYYYNKTDEDHYIYNGTIQQFTEHSYSISVKNHGLVSFTVKETVHGPVLNDFLDDYIVPENLSNSEIILAPKWIAHNVSTMIQAMYGFNYARNRAQFNESSQFFDCPAQNIVYADINGNIAIRPTGKVPIRIGNGTFPYNGSAGEGEWSGFIPFEKLPNTENPSQSYLVSANQKAIGPNYTDYFLQNYWASGYRARRINELLNNSNDITIEKMKEIQIDVKSTPARGLIPYLLKTIDELPQIQKTSIISSISSQLLQWNYDMDKDLSQPTIYRVWRKFYFDFTFNDEFNAFNAVRKPQLNVLEQITRDNGSSIWFNDISTPQNENRSDIIYKALIVTIDFLEEFYDTSDVNEWRYGLLHKLEFPHIAPGLDSLGIGPIEGDGEGYTVNPSPIWINSLNSITTAQHGASERMIVDLNDMSNSLSVIPSGQRGLVNSKHYSDQLEELFLEGKYHHQYFYKTPAEFPTSIIESQIIFLNTPDLRGIITASYITIGLAIGVICIIGGWKIKKSETIVKFKQKRSEATR